MNEQPATADDAITPLQRALALLVAQGVFTAEQTSAIHSCVEVGFDGSPDDIMGVMEPLLTAPGGAVTLAPAPVPSYLTAFPGFGSLGISLPPGWEDASSSADKCPCFGLDGPRGNYEFLLWVDHEDRTLRHGLLRQQHGARFQLEHVGEEGDRRVILETNNPRRVMEALLLVTLHTEVRDRQDALSGERPELDQLCHMVDEVLLLNV